MKVQKEEKKEETEAVFEEIRPVGENMMTSVQGATADPQPPRERKKGEMVALCAKRKYLPTKVGEK